MKRLYKITSGTDRGRNISKTPKKNVNAAEDFLEVIVNGHILSAAMSYLGMTSLHDRPLPSIVLHDIWMEDDNVRHTVLQDIAEDVVTEHVDLATIFKEPSLPTSGGDEVTAYEYACIMLTFWPFYFQLQRCCARG